MPVLSEFPSFWFFVALYVFVWFCLAQFYFLLELFSLFGREESASTTREPALRAV
jgi:hypothetical protein